MRMIAKYNGKCNKCGGRIFAGDEIEWERGQGAEHVKCPAVKKAAVSQGPKKMNARYDGRCIKCRLKINRGDAIFYDREKGAYHVDCEEVQKAAREKAARELAELREKAPWSVHASSAMGGIEFRQGDVLRAPESITEAGGPQYLVVVKATAEYVKEDGFSFGVGAESGYLYDADCREATAEEAAPVIERERKDAERREALKSLDEIKAKIRKEGVLPEGKNDPDSPEEARRMFNTENAYGGGDWIVVGPEHIWYVRNNGSDGASWEQNNVATGGAGAIGWRVDYSPELAGELERIEGVAGYLI